jgi:hypothetical protein
VTIFNKRNALVGFITLKALERRRQRRRKSVARIATFAGLGLISVGILAGVAAVVYKRHGGEIEQRLEGYAIGDDSESEIVGEYVSAGPDSIPAT